METIKQEIRRLLKILRDKGADEYEIRKLFEIPKSLSRLLITTGCMVSDNQGYNIDMWVLNVRNIPLNDLDYSDIKLSFEYAATRNHSCSTYIGIYSTNGKDLSGVNFPYQCYASSLVRLFPSTTAAIAVFIVFVLLIR